MIRYEFIDSSVREEDIHPDSIFDRERFMARNFVRDMEIAGGIQPCPVCGTGRHEILITKWGNRYAICPETWTISLATMPGDKTVFRYYHESRLSRFRASREYQVMMSEKRKDLWEGQIGWIEGRISRYMGNDRYRVIDWGSKSVGWLESLNTAGFVESLLVQEPLPPIGESPGFEGPADIVCLIDVLQRQTNPHGLLEKIAGRVRTGGLLVASCRAGSGFDVLTLREKSESIFPLDHILLPSPRGMERLLESSGFDVLELTTPGLLDIRYIQNAAQSVPTDQYFLRYLLEQGDEFLLDRMQGFLQRNNLSSHMRCVARKK